MTSPEANQNAYFQEPEMPDAKVFVVSPLRDLSISRKEVKWGILLPFDKNLSEFVWIEALLKAKPNIFKNPFGPYVNIILF